VLSASAPVRVTVATGSALGSQMRGQGTTGLQEALDDLSAMLDRAVAPATVVGARLAWLGILDERHLAESVGLSKDLSSVEDIDVAKAASDLAQLQAFYEGALASGARLLQTTLVNFLR
jgi:flagellar hook-associated protein 3 FlgL